MLFLLTGSFAKCLIHIQCTCICFHGNQVCWINAVFVRGKTTVHCFSVCFRLRGESPRISLVFECWDLRNLLINTGVSCLRSKWANTTKATLQLMPLCQKKSSLIYLCFKPRILKNNITLNCIINSQLGNYKFFK